MISNFTSLIFDVITKHKICAVVGLPKPRKEHAVVMAKFAEEILSDFSSVTSTLDNKLGPGTSNLGLRIGVS